MSSQKPRKISVKALKHAFETYVKKASKESGIFEESAFFIPAKTSGGEEVTVVLASSNNVSNVDDTMYLHRDNDPDSHIDDFLKAVADGAVFGVEAPNIGAGTNNIAYAYRAG